MKYPKELFFDATTLLETVCPEKILIIGNSLAELTDEYKKQCQLIKKNCDINQVSYSVNISDTIFLQRYDIAIVGEIIESDDRKKTEQIIGRLRDLCSPRIIIFADLNNSQWQENDLFGFGFNKYNHYEIDDAQFALYQHNIDSYKRTPDWFNPKNWANPQLWNKFWW